jgi:kynurenine formamidase
VNPNPTSARTITYHRVIDLSHIIHPNIPLWPGDPQVRADTVATLAQDGYFLRQIAIGEHSSTHMNAPISFHAGGADIASYPAEALVAPAVVIDVRGQARENADYLLTSADVFAWEAQHGDVPAGAVVLLLTGWSARWGEPASFIGTDADGAMHFPGFSEESVDFLLGQRAIAGVGIDTHGVDGGRDETLAVNQRVLQESRIVLENLTNLEALPARGATLVIGILHWRGGAGSPASVLAFIP